MSRRDSASATSPSEASVTRLSRSGTPPGSRPRSSGAGAEGFDEQVVEGKPDGAHASSSCRRRDPSRMAPARSADFDWSPPAKRDAVRMRLMPAAERSACRRRLEELLRIEHPAQQALPHAVAVHQGQEASLPDARLAPAAPPARPCPGGGGGTTRACVAGSPVGGPAAEPGASRVPTASKGMRPTSERTLQRRWPVASAVSARRICRGYVEVVVEESCPRRPTSRRRSLRCRGR